MDWISMVFVYKRSQHNTNIFKIKPNKNMNDTWKNENLSNKLISKYL